MEDGASHIEERNTYESLFSAPRSRNSVSTIQSNTPEVWDVYKQRGVRFDTLRRSSLFGAGRETVSGAKMALESWSQTKTESQFGMNLGEVQNPMSVGGTSDFNLRLE